MKPSKKMYGCLVLFLMASFVFLSSCNEAVPLQSKWRDKDIVINGSDEEWGDCMLYSYGTNQTYIGVYNDDAYVYMCFSTKDPEIWNALWRQGLIIWFNDTGAKDKQLGIRYPIVEENRIVSDSLSLKEMKIYTSEKDKGKVLSNVDAAKLGILAAIKTEENGRTIYEIRMPLRKTDLTPYAAGVSAKNAIGAGIMLYKAYRPRSATGISGFGGSMDMGSGGGGGGGGMGGGGMGGGGGGGGGGPFDSRDSGFSSRDVSSMRDVLSFFGTNDDNASSMSNDNVSIINAQPGGGGGGGGGMGGGGGSTGSDTGGTQGFTGETTTNFELWFNITLASGK